AAGVLMIAGSFLWAAPVWLLGGLAALILMIPVTATYNARPGAWRWGLGVSTVLLGCCAIGGITMLAANDPAGKTLLSGFFGGVFVLTLVSNFGVLRRS
ncbi:MAG TPA: hypothetical protein VHN79_07655, partial [Lacunisphaera sp.]|nr:hypothetical protein [Lacunisphaera sp.]